MPITRGSPLNATRTTVKTTKPTDTTDTTDLRSWRLSIVNNITANIDITRHQDINRCIFGILGKGRSVGGNINRRCMKDTVARDWQDCLSKNFYCTITPFTS